MTNSLTNHADNILQWLNSASNEELINALCRCDESNHYALNPLDSENPAPPDSLTLRVMAYLVSIGVNASPQQAKDLVSLCQLSHSEDNGEVGVPLGVLAREGGSEYTLDASADSCTVNLGSIAVYLKQEAEGVVVDLYSKGLRGEPIDTFYTFYSEAEDSLCEALGADLNEVDAWVSVAHNVDFDKEPPAQRHDWIIKFHEVNNPSAK